MTRKDSIPVEAVIGANYGDEGKGLFTDYLCRRRPGPVVVMSNGGCQRGHTVDDKKLGVRHVFHHFGSGTLLGAPTVFSSTFMLNPIKYVEERAELEAAGFRPRAFRAPGCLLQLPGDMLANQALERHRARSNSRHGSCGWGIWETVVRNRGMDRLTFEDFAWLTRAGKRAKILKSLEWQLENRLAEVDKSLYRKQLECVGSEGFIRHFIDDFEAMEESAEILETDDLLAVDWGKLGVDAQTLVVENAQGLLLDPEYAPEDPDGLRTVHSTPSKTGTAGVLEALKSRPGKLVLNYVTRSYVTRHGEGPFPEETPSMRFEDATNAPNEYQGSLRFGRLDGAAYGRMKARIAEDAQGADARLVATHMNEIENPLLLEGADYLSYEDDSSRITER